MFEASVVKARRVEQGQTIEGTIVAIGAEVALVSIGGKSEAQIDVAELKDEDGDIEVSIGDRLRAVVVSTKGGVILSRKRVRSAATQRELDNAFNSGLAVEGKVEGVNKGGYEVRIARERAFCPLSQIDIVRTADPAVHVGKTYTFRIIEYKEGGKSIVVSRRKQLEEEQQASADAVRNSIVPGAVLTGRVVSVPDFGAFVDLGGGVQGLLHVSDMSWSRAATPGAVVAPGDQITVKVLRVDEASGKIALGLKQLQDDPWSAVGATYQVGQVRPGRVTRVAEFGAFLELEPGIEGLLPFSETDLDRNSDTRKAFPIGSELEVAVLEVDASSRRIRLSRKAVAQQREQAELREYAARPDAAPATPLGSLADKLRDALKKD